MLNEHGFMDIRGMDVEIVEQAGQDSSDLPLRVAGQDHLVSQRHPRSIDFAS